MTANRTMIKNKYATKKTISQGLLDVALLTANATQLKYLLGIGKEHQYYYVMMTLTSLSLVIQILTGSMMVVIANTNVKNVSGQTRANILNNIITIGAFIVSTLNITISIYGIKSSDDDTVQEEAMGASADAVGEFFNLTSKILNSTSEILNSTEI